MNTTPPFQPSSSASPRPAPAFELEHARFDIAKNYLLGSPQLRHVLPGLLQGTVGLLAAPGGKGKSMLLLQLAVAVASGTSICGGLFDCVPPECSRPMTPGKVVLLLAEESRDIVSCRLHAILRTLTRGGSPLVPHDGDAALLQLLQQNLVVLPCADFGRPTLVDPRGRPTPHYDRLRSLSAGADLVLLDPLRQLHRGEEVDSAYMTDVMGLLHGVVAGTAGAVLVAHHTSQASSVSEYGERAQAARGSTAITDAVRFQVNLSTPATKWLLYNDIHFDQPDRLLRVDVAKSNHLPPVPTQLLLRGDGGVLRQPRRHELLTRVGSSTHAARGGKR